MHLCQLSTKYEPGHSISYKTVRVPSEIIYPGNATICHQKERWQNKFETTDAQRKNCNRVTALELSAEKLSVCACVWRLWLAGRKVEGGLNQFYSCKSSSGVPMELQIINICSVRLEIPKQHNHDETKQREQYRSESRPQENHKRTNIDLDYRHW